jgi:hypothetical protein
VEGRELEKIKKEKSRKRKTEQGGCSGELRKRRKRKWKR